MRWRFHYINNVLGNVYWHFSLKNKYKRKSWVSLRVLDLGNLGRCWVRREDVWIGFYKSPVPPILKHQSPQSSQLKPFPPFNPTFLSPFPRTLPLSVGLSRPSIGRILDMCPLFLTSDPLPPVNFLLHEVPLPFPHLPLSLTRCPRLLVSSVPTQLRPTLRFLTSLGLVLNSHTTLLLVSDVENTLKPKINFLQSLGFDEPEVNRKVVGSPGLLTLSVENNMSSKAEFFLERSPGLLTLSVENNMSPKAEFFLEEMEGDLEELKRFPQYFSFSLEKKIKPRHRALVEYGVQIAVVKGVKD
ncbi:hypothetical protein GOBAR_DD15975 [Gossypium barbadense]|nr:hypothetical protein GOBAR_DD15975 [Gossypium barbadense]